MTTRLVCITVALSWLLSIIFGFFDLFGTIAHFSQQQSTPAPHIPSMEPYMTPTSTSATSTSRTLLTTETVKPDNNFNNVLIDILFGPMGQQSQNLNRSSVNVNLKDLESFANSTFLSPDFLSLQYNSNMQKKLDLLRMKIQQPWFTKSVSYDVDLPSVSKGDTTKESIFKGIVSLEEMENILNNYAGRLNGTEDPTTTYQTTTPSTLVSQINRQTKINKFFHVFL